MEGHVVFFNSSVCNQQIEYENKILGTVDGQLSGSAWPFGLICREFTKLTCLEITGYRIKYSTVQCYGF